MKKPKLSAAESLRRLSLPDVVDAETLSTHLGLTPTTVRRYFQAGLLPGKRVANRWYATRRELLAFFEARPRLNERIFSALMNGEGQA